MLDKEKLAYDLALIYAKTKFEYADKSHIAATLYPDTEPEAELKLLAAYFEHAYNTFISQDLSDFAKL